MVAPSIEAAEAMGAKGAPSDEGERLAFEAWMKGHCWALCATWDGTGYRSDAEQGGGYCSKAANTRMLWAAWRDRAALASPSGEPAEIEERAREFATGHNTIVKVKALRHNDTPVTDDVLAEAMRRGKVLEKQTPSAVSVQYLPELEMLLLRLQDGTAIGLPVANYPEFSALTPDHLAHVSVCFQGQALCLDEADLHVSIEGLIRASDSLLMFAKQIVHFSKY